MQHTYLLPILSFLSFTASISKALEFVTQSECQQEYDDVNDTFSAEFYVACSVSTRIYLLLQSVVREFETHGIEYWIAMGTLLGATRHRHGFIPWDDDADIAICCNKGNEQRLLQLFDSWTQSDSDLDWVSKKMQFGYTVMNASYPKLDGFLWSTVAFLSAPHQHDHDDMHALSKWTYPRLDVFVYDCDAVGNKITSNSPILRSLMYLNNKHHEYDDVFPLQTANMYALTVKMPNNPEAWLDVCYKGSIVGDWRSNICTHIRHDRVQLDRLLPHKKVLKEKYKHPACLCQL